MNTKQSVVVIGAGIAGLAASALLAREGYRVTVLERQDAVGGRAGLWQSEGFRFDTGPSWYLMPEVFDHFFALFGTSAKRELDLVRLAPGYRVFFEGQPEPIDVADSRSQNVALFESVEPGAGAALERYLDSAADAYRLALDEFLYTNFEDKTKLASRSVLRRLVRLVDLMLTPLQRFIERYVRDRRLQQILGYPAVFLASSPFDAPALFHLMTHLDLEQGVLYPQGGFSELIARIRTIAEHAGVEIHTGVTVEEILLERADGGNHVLHRAVGVRVRPTHEPHAATSEIAAELVVSAADLHHTETALLPPAAQSYPESWWQRRNAGPGAVLAYLGVRGTVPGLQHHNLWFTGDWKGDFAQIFPARRGGRRSIPEPASFYACVPSVTDPSVAPPGDTNLFILIPVPSDVSIGHGGLNGQGDQAVEKAVDAAIARLAELTGVSDLANRILVRRTVGPADFAQDLNAWNGTALGPAHTLGQSAFFRAKVRSARVDGLFYTGGTTIPGVGLPMCLISAEVLLKTLRGETDARPLPEPARG